MMEMLRARMVMSTGEWGVEAENKVDGWGEDRIHLVCRYYGGRACRDCT